jgi:uncharacterized protein YutE (UPF0331/DUF86 family)
MHDKRDILYEMEIEKHIKTMTEILDSFSDKKEWVKTDFLAVERALQVLIESIIGLSRYTLQICFDMSVSRSREAIDELKKRTIFDSSTYQSLIKMIGFRNVLVHDYLNIDERIVTAICKKKNYAITGQVHRLLMDCLSTKT